MEEDPGFQPFRAIRNRLAARKEEAEKRRLERLLSSTKAEPQHDFRSPVEKASQSATDAAKALEQAIRECEAAIEIRDVEKAASLSAEIYLLSQKSLQLAQKATELATLDAKKRDKNRPQKQISVEEDKQDAEEEDKEIEIEDVKPSSPRNAESSPKISYKKGTSIKERIDADEATRRRMELKVRTRKLLEKRKSNKSENFDISRGMPPSSPILPTTKKNQPVLPEEEEFNPIGDID